MIIKTNEEIKEVYSAPNVNNDIMGIKSYLEMALNYVLPYLSQAQWDVLVDFYNNGLPEEPIEDLEDPEEPIEEPEEPIEDPEEPIDEPEQPVVITPEQREAALNKLLVAARIPIVHFAYFLYADDGDLRISDSGLTRIDSAEEKTPYATQIRRYKRARLRDAYMGIQNMLKLLNGNKSVYAEWANSEEYETLKSFLIWDVSTFKKYRNIEGYRTLEGIRPSMLTIQEDVIRNNIGQPLYDQILAECLADIYTDDTKSILPFIHKAIAHLSIANAIDENIVEFTPEGVSLLSFESAQAGAGDKQNPSDMTSLSFVRSEAIKKGMNAVQDLKDYLNTNASADKYNSYFISPLYVDPNKPIVESKYQQPDKGGSFFAV